MDYGIVAVPAAPVRLKPRHQREMVSQLLFGEAVQVLKEKGPLWIKVRSLHDNYEGWMTRNLLEDITKDEAFDLPSIVCSGVYNIIQIDEMKMQLPRAASLPNFKSGGGIFGKKTYSFDGDFIDRKSRTPEGEWLEELTGSWLNAPYLWGGRTIFGVDCSGFVQTNFRMMGIDLPRDAWQQAQAGSPVKKLRDCVKGDLAFFDDKDEIVHVGILLGDDRIIHASGRVRIDTIDRKGIINTSTGKRTHKLKAIRRYF